MGVLLWLGQDDAKGELTTAAALTFLLVLAMGQLARRRFRISIRTVMIITAIVGVMLAYVAREIGIINKEEDALAKIVEAGGRVTYRDLGEVDGKWFFTPAGMPIPLWVKEQLLGKHYFTSIYELHCVAWPTEDKPADLLRDLRRVEQLDLSFAHLGAGSSGRAFTSDDLADLPVMWELHSLRVAGDQLTPESAAGVIRQPDLETLHIVTLYTNRTPPSGLSRLTNIPAIAISPQHLRNEHYRELGELPALRSLRVDSVYYAPLFSRMTAPSAADFKALSSSRSIQTLDLHYIWLPEGGLEDLASMPQLRKLSLLGSSVPDDDLAEFRAARPDVEIVR